MKFSWLPKWQWLKRARRRSKNKRNRERSRGNCCYRLSFDNLEERISPASIVWKGGAAGNLWTNPANWVGNAVPAMNDSAIFDSTQPGGTNTNAVFNEGVGYAVSAIKIQNYTGTISASGALDASLISGTVAFAQSSGVVDLSAAKPFSNLSFGSNFNLSGGTFNSGSAQVTVNGNVAIAGGSFVEAANGQLQITGNLSISGGSFTEGTNGLVDATTLINNGQIVITNADMQVGSFFNNGTIAVSNGSLFATNAGGSPSINQALGRITLANNAVLSASGAGVALINQGAITIGVKCSLGAAADIFDFSQSSSGSLTVQIGGSPTSLLYGTEANNGSGTILGNLNIQLVNGFKPTHNATYSIFQPATAFAQGFQQITSPFRVAANLGNANFLDVIDAGVAWSGAAGTSWSKGANWVGGVLPGAADFAVFDTTLGASNGSAVYDVTSATTLLGVLVSHYSGTIAGVATAANLTVTATVSPGLSQSSGTVDFSRMGGQFTVNGNITVAGGKFVCGFTTLNGSFSNMGQITIANFLQMPSANTSVNSGQILLNGATIQDDAPGSVLINTSTGQITFDNNSDLIYKDLSNNGQITVNRGFLSSTGTLTNTGSITLGVQCNLAGDTFNQSATGSLTVAIGGDPFNNQFARQSGTGGMIAGSLIIQLVNGFVPTPGFSYPIFQPSNGFTGTFAHVTSPFECAHDGVNRHFLDVIYAPRSIVWRGTAGVSWTNGANWVGGVAPGSTDIAVFDATQPGGTNANAVIDATAIVISMQINHYSGTISAGPNFRLVLASAANPGYSQSSGAVNFSGATIAGMGDFADFNLSGGTFNPGGEPAFIDGDLNISGGSFIEDSANAQVSVGLGHSVNNSGQLHVVGQFAALAWAGPLTNNGEIALANSAVVGGGVAPANEQRPDHRGQRDFARQLVHQQRANDRPKQWIDIRK